MPEQLEIVETLYRFDEPLLFVARVGTLQALFLKTDETEQKQLFLSCYVDNEHIEALKDGRISIRGAYEAQKDLTVVSTDFEYQVGEYTSYARTASQVEPLLPERGVGILPRFGECPDVLQEKDALFSVYFKGAGLNRERIAYSTLMELLGTVQKFAKNVIAPPELRGLRASTFDFTVGDPALGSLMVSIKQPEFDLRKLRLNEKRRDLTRDQLTNGLERQKDELFADMEELVDLSSNEDAQSDRVEDTYFSLRGLLPTENTPFQSVMFSASSGDGFKRLSIDRSKADAIRQEHEGRDFRPNTRSGVIVEINAASATILVRSRLGRITTCAFDRDTFEALQTNRAFKIGSQTRLSGQLASRVRRDLMHVDAIDSLEAQRS